MQFGKGGSLIGLCAAFAALAVFVPSVPALGQGQYKVLDQWKVGGDGGWDYLAVDPATSQLYVTRGSHVMVIDTATGKVAADITGFKGTHGVAFSTDGKTGFISDGGSNQVAVFDRATHEVTARIAAGTNPDGLLFEPYSQSVWAFNGSSKNATVIDAKTNAVLATIPLPGKPEFPTSDGKGSVFVNIEDKNLVVHLDAKAHKSLAEWPIAPCDSPSGMAIDVANGLVFSVCDGNVMTVTDTATGKVIATPKIGEGPDAAGFDANTGNIYSSNGGGTLTVLHEDSPRSFSVVDTVTTQKSARTMALDGSTGKVYLAAARMGPRPAATTQNPHPWPQMVPGSFVILVVGK